MTTQAAPWHEKGHVTPPHADRRRICVNFMWSYPAAVQRDSGRYSTRAGVLTASYPVYETTNFTAPSLLQDVAGVLKMCGWSISWCQRPLGQTTAQTVALFQRIDQAGHSQPIDERILDGKAT